MEGRAPRPVTRLDARDTRRMTTTKEVPFDFVSQCPVDLPDRCFCSFSKLGSRMIVGWQHAGLWEAGANPALPRNCKRGHRNRSLGKLEKDNHGKAGCSNWMLGQSSFERQLTS